MKILALESTQQRPLTNTTIQIQIKGKDSGFLSCTTDATGYFQLDDKYKGQEIAYYLKAGSSSQSITADDKATLYVDTSKQTTGGKEKQTTQTYK